MSREERSIKVFLLLAIVLFFLVVLSKSQDVRAFRLRLIEKIAEAQTKDRAKKEIQEIERIEQKNIQTLATLVAIDQITHSLYEQRKNPFVVRVDEKEQVKELERQVKKLKDLLE